MASESRVQLAVSFSSCRRPKPGQRVELRAAVVLARLPLGADPAFLLEFVQGRVKRPVAHLQHVARNLLQPLADRPAIQRLEGQDLQ